MTLRKFESRLLELLGFGLNLHADADTGEAIIADAMYHYYFEQGPVRSRENAVTIVPQISGACLLALENERYETIAGNTQYLAELKQLMRFVIKWFARG